MSPTELAQEISITDLGAGPQTVHGQAGSVNIAFPGPAVPLASSGSFVRVFFGHSATIPPGARIEVAVNGRPLSDSALSTGTAGGAVFESRVPQEILNRDGPNLLQARFLLPTAAPAVEGLFGRLDGQTLIHYALRRPAGADSLALNDFPYSLIEPASATSSPPLALVLPDKPETVELGDALRITAAVGRSARSRRVQPKVITTGQVDWPGGVVGPAVVVGRVDRLPLIGRLLQAAGFSKTDRGWQSPGGGQVAGTDDGLLATLISPFDGRSPLVIVTGVSDGALGRATEALVGADTKGLAASTAVVTGTGLAPGPGPAQRLLGLAGLVPPDTFVEGAGEHRVVFGVPVPAIDSGQAGSVRFTTAGPATYVSGPATVTLEVNDHPLPAAQVALTAQPEQVVLPLAGDLLRPGIDGFEISIHLSGGRTQLFIAGSAIALPPAPSSGFGLEALPYPFFEPVANDSLSVVLADRQSATLDTAATALAALGSRSLAPPPRVRLRPLEPTRKFFADTASVLVIGTPPGAGQTAGGPTLSLHLGLKGRADLAPVQSLGSSAAGSSRASVGWLDEVSQPDSGLQAALWVGGTDSSAAQGAAAALYEHGLTHRVALVAADRSIRAPTGAAQEPLVRTPLELRIAELLPVLALGGLLIFLGLEMTRLRRSFR
ncbi:MAG: cellulose biosynthesis cyclic di-GMP-binding regulatory protein BcsB [Candidatus Dormibacteraeota bacterium]|nr:cellulose biosynthesis cyclic di-GMP-binding regulatory protein BcsB [Candidatus Dormibacteraeota bacterium]